MRNFAGKSSFLLLLFFGAAKKSKFNIKLQKDLQDL